MPTPQRPMRAREQKSPMPWELLGVGWGCRNGVCARAQIFLPFQWSPLRFFFELPMGLPWRFSLQLFLGAFPWLYARTRKYCFRAIFPRRLSNKKAPRVFAWRFSMALLLVSEAPYLNGSARGVKRYVKHWAKRAFILRKVAIGTALAKP